MGDESQMIDQINKTVRLLKRRIEFEDYFSSQGIPFKSKEDSGATSYDVLLNQVNNCRLCPLYKSRKHAVFGDGNKDAELMFVGEAPGRDEDLAGLPFVGVAGQLLTNIIKAMGLERKDVYITNVLHCRPPGNRNPIPEEVACCRPYLLGLIKVIKPKIICTLGKFAAQALLGVSTPISRLRGNFYEFEGIKLMPTFHPAYLLRNPEDKRLVWNDVQKIMQLLKNNET